MDQVASTVKKAVEAVQPSSTYQELVRYLTTSAGGVPAIVAKTLPVGERGAYVVPGYLANRDYSGITSPTVVLDNYTALFAPQTLGNTLIHELAHAADDRMSDQYYSKKQKPGIQFADAFKKLHITGAFDQLAQTAYPEFAKKKSDYRATNSELKAFGVGSTISGNEHNPAPPHIDATAATEFMILLDLALRDLKARK